VTTPPRATARRGDAKLGPALNWSALDPLD